MLLNPCVTHTTLLVQKMSKISVKKINNNNHSRFPLLLTINNELLTFFKINNKKKINNLKIKLTFKWFRITLLPS